MTESSTFPVEARAQRPLLTLADPSRLLSGIRALLTDGYGPYEAVVGFRQDDGSHRMVRGRATRLEAVEHGEVLRFDDGFTVPLHAVEAFSVDLPAEALSA